MNDHVINGLLKKRSELIGKITYYKQEIKTTNEEVKHLDGTLRLFDPNIKLSHLSGKLFRPNNYLFRHGELSRLIFEIMKSKDELLKVEDIANEILDRKGFNLDVKDLVGTVRRSLNHYAKKGILKSIDNGDFRKSWIIK